jgi:hypothetical protein
VFLTLALVLVLDLNSLRRRHRKRSIPSFGHRVVVDPRPAIQGEESMNSRPFRLLPRLVIPSALLFALQVAYVAPAFSAEEAVAADPKHYTVEFENDKVRVLRIKYGPNEKSVMHHHPASVAVFLTHAKAKFTMPDGSTADVESKAGSVEWDAGGDHLPENVTDKPFELVLVELKESSTPAD